ncbi:hypothetical protein [Streptomyces lydicus]|uniref:hypothetical protein n=1 Tax=Streptomyces lydicus TaxID=47763 RepID=UPI0037942607
MLNPLIHWEPGTPVRYHGSLADLRGGIYHAYPCDCLRCTDHRGLLGVHFALMDSAGVTVANCVRPRSITPDDDDSL